MRYQLFFSTVFFCFATSLSAQIEFKSLSVDDGLSQSDVHSFCEDKYGYLWIATRDGLNRYDGSTFTIYHHVDNDSTTLLDDRVWKVRKDQCGNVWAASPRGLNRYNYDRNNFLSFPYKSSLGKNLVTDLLITDAYIFIARKIGLTAFDLNAQRFVNTNVVKAVEGLEVKNIRQDRHAVFWITTTEGLFTYDEELKLIKEGQSMLALEVMPNGEMLLGTDKNIIVFNDYIPTDTIPIQPEYKLGLENADFTIDDTHIWYSILNHGVYRIDRTSKSYEFLNDLNSQIDKEYLVRAKEMFTTSDNNVWLGTGGFGIKMYNSQNSKIYNFRKDIHLSNSLNSNYVNSIFSADDTTVFIATNNGLDRINRVTGEKRKLPFSDNHQEFPVNTLFQDSNDDTWIGSTLGLSKLVKGVPKNLLTNCNVTSIAELDQSNLLLIIKGKLLRFNKNTLEVDAMGLEELKYINRALLVEEKQVWVGTQTDVILFKRVNDQLQIEKQFVKPQNANCIYRDSQSNLWVGTWGNGLYAYDPVLDEFVKSPISTQLLNQTVYGILEDAQGNFWMSTNKGLSCYIVANQEVITFDANQGLQSNEFNKNAYYKSKNGIMYFGGIKGLSVFDPMTLLDIPKIKPPLITKVYVNNQALSESTWFEKDGPLKLDYDMRNIAFDVTSIALISSDRIKYRYQLENFNDSSITTVQKYINFTNLDPGAYTLNLWSTDTFGRWQQNKNTFEFRIERPLWKYPVIQVFFILLLAYAGVGIYRWRIRQLKHQKTLLEEKIDQRTKIIQEQNLMLNDAKESLETKVKERTDDLQHLNAELKTQNLQLDQFNHIIAHNLRGPVARIQSLVSLFKKGQLKSGEEPKFLGYIYDSVKNIDNTIKDMSVLLHVRETKEQVLQPVFVNEAIIAEVKAAELELKENDIEVIMNNTQVHILGNKAYLESIFYNLLNNAIKYSDPEKAERKIEIKVEKYAGSVQILFKDTGVGIDMKLAKDKIFTLYQRFNEKKQGRGVGLYMAKTQIEAMGGTIHVESTLGKGTTFIISFPGHE